MPFNKPHMEFVELDMAEGWVTPDGFVHVATHGEVEVAGQMEAA